MHPWYLVFATCDVLLTWHILHSWDGIELNPIAAGVIYSGGMTGATFFKFATVGFVMWACEYLGRHRLTIGRRLLIYALIANGLAVGASVTQLAMIG